MAQVLDLRGRQPIRDRTPILLDPSGGRARVLAWVGRAVAVVFLLWLIGLVFAGLGLLPSGALPFGRAFVGQSPPSLKALPRVTQPRFLAPAALGQPGAAALAHGAAGSSAVAGSSGTGSAKLHGGGSTTASRSGLVPPAKPGHGNGQTGATPGGTAGTTSSPASGSGNGVRAGGSGPGRTQSQTSPGHTKTSSSTGSTSAGSSGSSSGHGHQTTTTTTTTTPGKSASVSGHAAAG